MLSLSVAVRYQTIASDHLGSTGRNRIYDPSLGRFLSRDPSGFAGGANVYRYAADPLLSRDPTGLRVLMHSKERKLKDEFLRRLTALSGFTLTMSPAGAGWAEVLAAGSMGGIIIGQRTLRTLLRSDFKIEFRLVDNDTAVLAWPGTGRGLD